MRRHAPWLAGCAVVVAAMAVAALPEAVPAGRAGTAPVDGELLVRVDAKRPNVVLRWDPARGAARIFHQARGALTDLEVAPDGRWVALLELLPGVVAAEGGVQTESFAHRPASRLVVLDASGSVAHEVEDVWHFEWSPDGSAIAYITGSYFEGGVGFAPERTWRLELSGRQAEALPGLDRAYELHWLDGDGERALFARVLGAGPPGHPVRYDLETGDVTRPSSPAFHLSPDGGYYYLEPYEAIERGLCRPGDRDDSCWRAFERAGDRPVALPDGAGRVLGWDRAADHQLVLEVPSGAVGRRRSPRPRPGVVDVATGRWVEKPLVGRKGGPTTHHWRSARGWAGLP